MAPVSKPRAKMKMRVALPRGMEEVLAMCFDSATTPELTMAMVVALMVEP